jgi:hypothetical protein
MAGSRRRETRENSEGENEGHDNLHADRKTAAKAEDGGDGGIYMYGVLEPPKDENAK